jgi:hypothetical protein
MSRRPLVLLLAFLALALAPVAAAGGPDMVLGADNDGVRSPALVQAKASASLLRLAGFTSVRVTVRWRPGEIAPPPAEVAALRNAETAASLHGLRVLVSLVPDGPAATPLAVDLQAQFAAYAASLALSFPTFDDLVVGDEPNAAASWAPQLNPDGTDAAAPAYLQLLARTYDAVKAVDTGVRVWGGALSSRGATPPAGADGIAPAVFVRDLGAAYRASGRQAPVMDGLVIHPDPGPAAGGPRVARPRSTTIGVADYDRLVASLALAFDGTLQLGTDLPVLYDGFSVQTRPPRGRATAYTGSEPATGLLDETRQGADYAAALQLAFCQPSVAGVGFARLRDDAALEGSQAGLFYADGSPKASLYPVRDALRRVRGGSIARCEGLGLDVTALTVKFPTAAQLQRGVRDVRFSCSLDCAWELRALRADGATLARRRGFGRAEIPVVVSLRGARLGSGAVRFRLTVSHPVNPGVPESRESALRMAR